MFVQIEWVGWPSDRRPLGVLVIFVNTGKLFVQSQCMQVLILVFQTLWLKNTIFPLDEQFIPDLVLKKL